MTEQPGTPSRTPGEASDILAGHWVLRLAPAEARPYLRLVRIDRPIGTWLLLFPCWWSLALAAAAAGEVPDLRLGALFAIGALVMRGAGCIVNDIADRNIDAQVARTAQRPIASGQVSVARAVAFLGALLLLGLVILIRFNGFAILLGVAALPLIAAYPFMKRITYWPQAWLGLTFNWGALLGWAAVTGGLGPPALLLYAAGVAWTLGYDTIYAHQDKEDDALIGVKSSARRLGEATRPWLYAFYAAAVVLIGVAGALAGLAWPFYLGLGLAAAQLAWQAARVDIDAPADCLAKFKSNKGLGLIVFAAIVAGRVAG
ncbi:MAG: 4-hydroxybenzoate octaprenyltransferase [Proteobacteria bacterium]|nr:4-hydroxybenzoate octaprenyltransferase [Pseudomonadota bacterium]